MGERTYGHDETDEFETLAEAERLNDGTVRFAVVQIDKRPDSSSTESRRTDDERRLI